MAQTPSASQTRFITYLRVSTMKQGERGLGIEAQRQAVDSYVQRHGDAGVVLAEYVEVESGKRDDRPELEEAKQHARLAGARLVIAKLDRLSRDMHFLTGLMKGGVDFVAADMPDANTFTVHIFAAAAQHEREAISERTKAALAVAKRRLALEGKRLGNPNGAAHLRGLGNDAAVSAIKGKADAHAENLRGTVEALEGAGVTTASGIAKELNARYMLTPRNGKWTATAVQRLRARLAAA